ncbi:MAG TPA: hypothetical protein VFF04_06895 [Candidatus Babeliales bacterium]|nr:hypothetical protein [Candidatus Babeliales bacterium]
MKYLYVFIFLCALMPKGLRANLLPEGNYIGPCHNCTYEKGILTCNCLYEICDADFHCTQHQQQVIGKGCRIYNYDIKRGNFSCAPEPMPTPPPGCINCSYDSETDTFTCTCQTQYPNDPSAGIDSNDLSSNVSSKSGCTEYINDNGSLDCKS